MKNTFAICCLFLSLINLSCEQFLGLGPEDSETYIRVLGGYAAQEGIAFARLAENDDNLELAILGHQLSYQDEADYDIYLALTDLGGHLGLDISLDASTNGQISDDFAVDLQLRSQGIFIFGNSHLRESDKDGLLLELDDQLNIKQQVKIGSSSYDESIQAVASLPNGDFVLVGSTTQIDLNKNGYDSANPTTSQGIAWDSTDFWILRVDQNGGLIWETIFGFRGIDCANAVEVIDNEIMVAATTDFPDIGEDRPEDRDKDICLLKLNEQGDLLGMQVYGESEADEYAADLVIDKNQEIIAMGNSIMRDSTQFSNILLLNLDVNLSLIATPSIVDDQYLNPTANAMTLLEDGDLLLTGFIEIGTSGTGSFFFPFHTNIMLLQTDRSGNVRWQRSFGERARESGSASITLSDGSIITLGTFGFEGNPMIALIKTDAQGNLVP